jgi:hypothetical protein
MRGFFVFKNSWLFKDIFREIEAFVEISILFKAFSDKLRASLE